MTLQRFSHQDKLSDIIANEFNDNEIIIAQIPPGWGKSGLAYYIHEKLDTKSLILNHNRVLVDQYEDLFKDVKDVVCPRELEGTKCIYHQYTIEIPNRDAVHKYLHLHKLKIYRTILPH